MFSSLKNKKQLLGFGILIIVFIKAFSFIFDAKIDLNGDNLEYFTYAKAILKGGYTNLMSPSNHYTNNFPPGYPFLLSFLMLFTKKIVALKIYNGLMLLGGTLLLFHTLRKTNDTKIWLFVAFGTASLINPDVLDFATMLMSEMSYFLFIALSAFFLYKSDKDNPVKDIYFWLMILSAAYAYHIRTAAVAIMGGIILHYLFSKKWKHLGLSIAGYIVALLPWMIRNKIRGVGASRYFSQMTQVNAWDKNAGTLDTKGMIERFGDNLTALITKQIPDAIYSAEVDYNVGATLGQWFIGLILLSLIAYGLFRIKELNLFFIGVLLATGATLLPWNGGGGTRYIIAIIPIIYLGFFSGIYHIAQHFMKNSKLVNTIPAVVLIIIFFAVKPELVKLNEFAKSDFHPAYKNYFTIAKSVKENTPEGTYICCRKPALFYFNADRPAGKYTFSPDDKKMISHMYRANFSYVVLEQLGYGSTPRYLYPTIQKNPKVFKIVLHLKNPDTYLFKFDRKEAEKVLGTNDN